jgi:Ni,Fe-hydrogenase III small subunit
VALKQIVVTGIKTEPPPAADETVRFSARLQGAILNQLGRALTIRHVDAGSCNGCELEIHTMNNPYHSLEGLGMKFVAPGAVLPALLRE